MPNGCELELRLIRADDKALLKAGFQALSHESRYSRFLSPKTALSDDDLRYLTELDGESHFALGAVEKKTGRGVGVARFVRIPEHPELGDAAVTVVDSWQKRGIGRLLFRHLVPAAVERGLTWFQLDIANHNIAMRQLVTSAAHESSRGVVTVQEALGVVTLKLPLV